MKVIEIKELLELINDISHPKLAELYKDERKSVRKLVDQTIKRIKNDEKLKEDHQKRLIFENELGQAGYRYICGVDEVGRGPLAGPLVTAAVILPQDCSALIGVNDSKSMSQQRRLYFDQLIKEHALAYQITVTPVSVIDQVNIYEATRISMKQSVEQLSIQPDYLLLDAMQIETQLPQMKLIKGDQRSLSIAAASIIAKVYRDQLMVAYAKAYPEFGFDQHMGYGTAQHLAALKTYGYTPIHRQSFAPVQAIHQVYQTRAN